MNNLFDKFKILIQFYKVIGIDEDELIVLLILDQLLNFEKQFITSEDINELCNFDKHKIDKILVQLLQKKLLLIETKDKLRMDLKPLWNKLFDYFQSKITPQQKTIVDEVNDFLEVKLSVEQEQIIHNWIEQSLTKIDLKKILFAIEIKNKIITFNDLENYINNFLNKKPKQLIEFNWLLNDVDDNFLND